MTEDELTGLAEQMAAQIAAMVEHPPFADVESNAVEALILAALQRVQRLMQVERDHARANASILAHAYEHDSRPPWPVLRDSLAYPRLPARPGTEEDTHDRR